MLPVMAILSLLGFASLAVASALPASAVAFDALQGPHLIAKRAAGNGTCTGPDFATSDLVGQPGPGNCESDWGKGYLPITNLTIWSDNTYITGIQATYSDGTVTKIYGATSKTRTSNLGINYGQGDKFTQATLYGHIGAKNSYLQHIDLKTIKGGSLSAGGFAHSTLKHEEAVGIGILFGFEVTYTTKGALGGLRFVFLEPPITEIQITDVQFPNGPVGSSDRIFPRTIGKAHFYNNGSQAQQYQFNNQLTMTQAYTFMQAFTLTFQFTEAIALDFGFNLLGIEQKGTSTTTFQWTASETTTFSAAFTQSEQVQYNAQVVLQPQTGVDCLAIAGQGAGTFFYTSLVTLSLKNGNSYTFPENGYVTVQAISQGIVTCDEADHA